MSRVARRDTSRREPCVKAYTGQKYMRMSVHRDHDVGRFDHDGHGASDFQSQILHGLVGDRRCHDLAPSYIDADMRGRGAVFEIDDDPHEKEPETLILRFCDLVESLDEEGLIKWRDASQRIIDLGYEVDTNNDRLAISLGPNTLGRMAALDITLAFTIYPPDSK